MPSPGDTRAAAIWAALRTVIDPCSLVNGTHLSLVDLGMIDDVVVRPDGSVLISLLLDDPLCLYMGAIHDEIRARTSAALGGAALEIAIKGDVIWTTEHATAETRRKISLWQEQRRERLDRQVSALPMPRVRQQTAGPR
jgi:metal-sulfur cluster biosynthetic enzyme